jgi:hypothetical protein
LSTASGSLTDVVSVGRDDDPFGGDDGFTAQIEVRYAAGANVCAPWTLTVRQGTNCTQ